MIVKESLLLIALCCLIQHLRAADVGCSSREKPFTPSESRQLMAVQNGFSLAIRSLRSALAEIKHDYDEFEEIYQQKIKVARSWASSIESGEKAKEASNLIYFANVLARVERTRYSVASKALKDALKRVEAIQEFQKNCRPRGANIVINFMDEITMNVELLEIFTARAIARANIEADRQSRHHWNWLLLLINHHRTVNRIPEFDGLDKKAIYDLQRLRMKGQHLHTMFELIKEKTLRLLKIPQNYEYLNYIDLMLESDVECPTCFQYSGDPDFYNTRPMFENQKSVDIIVRQTIGETLMKKLDYLGLENSNWHAQRGIPHFSKDAKLAVTRSDVDKLVNDIISDEAQLDGVPIKVRLSKEKNKLQSELEEKQREFDELERNYWYKRELDEGLSGSIPLENEEAYEQALIDGRRELKKRLKKYQDDFDVIKRIYGKIIESANGPSEIESPESAFNLNETADAIMLIEAIQYSVASKILVSVDTNLGKELYLIGESVDGEQKFMPLTIIPIFIEYVLARASIEADRQSDEQWRWLYMMILYNRSPTPFKREHLVLEGIASSRLKQLRGQEKLLYGMVSEDLLRLFAYHPFLAEKCLEGFDVLIEDTVGDSKFETLTRSEEHYNTRPLFVNQEMVDKIMRIMIDANSMRYDRKLSKLGVNELSNPDLDVNPFGPPEYRNINFPVRKEWRYAVEDGHNYYSRTEMRRVRRDNIDHLIGYQPQLIH